MNLGGYDLDCDLWLWFGYYDFGYAIIIFGYDIKQGNLGNRPVWPRQQTCMT